MSLPHPSCLPEAFETERLLIRPPRPGDAQELNDAVRESLESLRPWMDWAQRAPTLAQSRDYIRHTREAIDRGSDVGLLLFLRGRDRLVGGSGLHRISWGVPKFEVGYWCRSRYEGQGYIAEAVRGITAVGFELLGANRMEIRCDPANERSRRVAERVGYVLEAELRNDARAPSGALRNSLVYSLIPSDYAQIREGWAEPFRLVSGGDDRPARREWL